MFFYVRRDDPARCPNCGERVSPYAAGCSLCGMTLDPARWEQAPSLAQHLAARWRRRRDGRRR
jgi:predicted amidophosphoribosyltransferase